ncbi:hypothetical protein WJX74_003633 [Apatococcus lobatus]|uniref:Kinesin motor domain-containing protein n=1 Tax=Apatococcus lobatus TaxID=904363 RepID=A0AAW1RPU8_9CHLO
MQEDVPLTPRSTSFSRPTASWLRREENHQPISFEQNLRAGAATPGKRGKWRPGRSDVPSTPGRTPMRPTPRGTPGPSGRKPAVPPLNMRAHSHHGDDLSMPGSPGDSASIRSVDDLSPRSMVDEDGRQSRPGSSDNVQVVIRVRPPPAEAADEGSSIACTTANRIQIRTHPADRTHTFSYDHVMTQSSMQSDMFNVVGLPIVESCMMGYNASIFAYGMTGAGKTFTMLGSMSAPEQRGLAPRIFEALFQRIAEAEDIAGRERLRYSLKCSFLEIYNETITDLLHPASVNLQIREDTRRGCYVEGLSEEIVLNVDEAMALMRRGVENRRTGETKMNRESSRSHCVFSCSLEGNSKGTGGLTNTRFSRLNLIDLAGSERNKASGAGGDHFKEAISINSSLTALGRVIMELVEAQNRRAAKRHFHVPYRDSRLTFLLQDSLGGNAKTMIIANVLPTFAAAHETLSTLQFASRAKHIRNKAIVNEDTNGELALLQRELHRLRRELELVQAQSTEPLVAENADLRRQIQEQQETEGQLTQRLDGMLSESRRHKHEAELARQACTDMDQQGRGLQERVRELASRLEQAQAAAASDTAQKVNQAEQLQADLDAANSRLATGEVAREQVAEKCKIVEAALAAEQKATKGLQGSLSQQQAAVETLRQENAEHSSRLQAELQAAAADIDAAQESRAQVEGELQDAQAALASEQSSSKALQDHLDERQAAMQALQKDKSAVQESLAAKATICRELQQAVVDAEAAAKAAQEDNQQLVTEAESLSAKLAHLRSVAEADRAASEERAAQLAGEIEELNTEVSENRQGRREERSTSQRLEEECRRLRREAQETALEMDARSRRERRQLTDLTKVVQDLEATCDLLRNNLHDEAKRTAKYKRAFTEIDGLIAWARSPPVSTGRPARSNMFSSNPVTGSPTSSLLDGARRRLSEGAMSSGKQPAGLPSPEPRRGTSSLVTPLRLPQMESRTGSVGSASIVKSPVPDSGPGDEENMPPEARSSGRTKERRLSGTRFSPRGPKASPRPADARSPGFKSPSPPKLVIPEGSNGRGKAAQKRREHTGLV